MDFPLTAPHLTTAHFTTPHNTSLQLTSAHLTSPHITSPHLTTPLRPPSGPVFYGSKLTFLLFHLSSPYPVYAFLFSPLLAISATKTRRDPPPDPPKSGPKPLDATWYHPPLDRLFRPGGSGPSQDAPKRASEPHKTRPRRPKTLPRPPQEGPRPLEDGSKTAQDLPRPTRDGPRRPKTRSRSS